MTNPYDNAKPEPADAIEWEDVEDLTQTAKIRAALDSNRAGIRWFDEKFVDDDEIFN